MLLPPVQPPAGRAPELVVDGAPAPAVDLEQEEQGAQSDIRPLRLCTTVGSVAALEAALVPRIM